ncbi:MAG: hypothetical protein WCB19_03115 [Thermoplasmata archaeon]
MLRLHGVLPLLRVLLHRRHLLRDLPPPHVNRRSPRVPSVL